MKGCGLGMGLLLDLMSVRGAIQRERIEVLPVHAGVSTREERQVRQACCEFCSACVLTACFPSN